MWADLSQRLTAALHLTTPPVAITFSASAPDGVEAFSAPMPDPTPDGRTGRVPAGCAFWVHGASRTFTTVPEDHGNCSVGSYTHGMIPLEEAATHADVGALVEAGWVTPEMFPVIPAVMERPEFVTYGPLEDSPVDPDVVLLRVNPKQLMVLSDALPGLRIEGKPQCHIIAVAKEQGAPAASVGCILSRTRTAMPSTESTCALPGPALVDIVDRVEKTAAVDAGVSAYAAQDALRFG
ncbi:MAG TPA: DUF169 domain-containing protein [Acidimicrobiales bacterium]|nr:DUF169 domain-containing protein [Acidimicrobiales bacterium]